jgi:aerobic carbon-monoxide dehydrogenase large subunit
MKFGFGQSAPRKEDDPLLRGRGHYVGDVAPPDTPCAVVLRSPHSHAGFEIDAAKARAMPGVRLVLTGSETANLGPLPCAVELPNTRIDVPSYPVLALEVKGAGEAGAIGSCPAVMNAIVDALWRAHGIPNVDMPATPHRVWSAINTAPSSNVH